MVCPLMTHKRHWLPKSWAAMTVEEKLETLLHEKADKQNLSVLAATLGGIGNAVKKIEKEISEMRQEPKPKKSKP
jgi:nitrogen regulatory protein PII-like uncharacterized protein